MKFENPLFLVLIIPVVLIFYWKFKQRPGTIEYSLAGFLKANIKSSVLRKYIFFVLRGIVFTLIILALARPKGEIEEKSPVNPAVDIMMVLDVSTSMRAIDFEPRNRMEAALIGSREFIKSRAMDRIGLVVFSGKPLLHAPLTTDTKSLIRLTEYIEPGMVKIPGTAIGSGISLGLKYLEKADAPEQVMVLLSDGANNAGTIAPLTAARAARGMGIKIYTIGCGRPGPARVPVEHPEDQFKTRLVTIPDELDEETLTRIAEKTGGKYFRATSLMKFNEIYEEIEKLETRDVPHRGHYQYNELYFNFILAALLFMVAEIILRFLNWGLIR